MGQIILKQIKNPNNFPKKLQNKWGLKTFLFLGIFFCEGYRFLIKWFPIKKCIFELKNEVMEFKLCIYN